MGNELKIKTKAPAKMRGGKRTDLAGTSGGPGGYFERALGGEADRKSVGRDGFSGLQWTIPDHPMQIKFSRNLKKFSTAAKAGAARELAGGGWWEGNCKLQIGDCELQIADRRLPAGCDFFRVQNLGRKAVGVQARRAKSPFRERQRRSIIQPRVAAAAKRRRLPWVCVPK